VKTDRLGDRVPRADDQVAAELAQLLAQHRDGFGQKPCSVRRRSERGVDNEQRHHPAGPCASARQRRVVMNPQVAGEQHDGGVHDPPWVEVSS
jgi:hypothetical protein